MRIARQARTHSRERVSSSSETHQTENLGQWVSINWNVNIGFIRFPTFWAGRDAVGGKRRGEEAVNWNTNAEAGAVDARHQSWMRDWKKEGKAAHKNAQEKPMNQKWARGGGYWRNWGGVVLNNGLLLDFEFKVLINFLMSCLISNDFILRCSQMKILN